MKKYLSDKEVAARYGVKRDAVWSWTRKNKFPKPIKFSPGCTRWALDDIENHEEALRKD